MVRFFQNLKAGRQWLCCLGSIVGLIVLSGTAVGLQTDLSPPVDAQAKRRVDQANKKGGRPTKKLSDSRIKELQDFAQDHHPEILPLLNFLKEKRRKKFDKVMKGLDRDVSNLERAKKKSVEAYQRGLDAWINQSKIQLYAAQYRIAADEETAAKLREKIQQLVEKSIDARISQLEREKEGALARGRRLGNAIMKLKSERTTNIQKRIEAVTKNAPKMQSTKTVSTKERRKNKAADAENAAAAKPEENNNNN